MNPIFDLKVEHDAMAIILHGMKKRATDIRMNVYVDLFRIGQIIDFLRNFNDHCHHEKEEKVLFPALLEHDIQWTADTINHLINEHHTANQFLNEIDERMNEYLTGHSQSLESLATSMNKYVLLEENHIKTENDIMLPLSSKLLDKQKQDSISMDFKNIQDHHVSHPKHFEYYLLLTKLYSETKVAYVSDL
jgi:hemerythrin-like domain-containing protein